MYRTLIEWHDPAGNRHAPDAVEALDPEIVFDIEHLLAQETIIEVPAPDPVKPARVSKKNDAATELEP